ncbi:hypothetical protein [Mesorhizobium sp. GbtcB19]|uniref:hypothetical protein n=1 Tax=Mesorhizobium sp. GbtcB19 TaxID=2824764 RepID=UPI001C2F3486|nr:hypothetical protein [Mesorhizobium sp. GbtcB19]
MTEDRENKQQASTEANAIRGWDKLPNELLHGIITHAVNDTDAWKARETFHGVSLTSRHLHELTKSKVLQEYKENLDGGTLVSDAVIETAFKNNNFSDNIYGWDRRHIGTEAAAVTHALEFQPPEKRSEIFNNIAGRDVQHRMLGYSEIVERADLLQEHEISQIDRNALDTFRDDNPGLGKYQAAEVLVKRYNDLSSEIRAKLQETLSNNEKQNQRADFSDAIVNCKPSLLEDESLQNVVRESLDVMEDPHEALSQLALYIDKNSRAETDFIIKESLRRLGGMTVLGEEHGLNAPARAIAKVSDGNLSPENRKLIEQLRQSHTEEGRALASAFQELERDRPAEASIEGGMRGSIKLLSKLNRSQNMSNEVAAIEGVGDVAISNEKQMNAARRALMNSVCDRSARGR